MASANDITIQFQVSDSEVSGGLMSAINDGSDVSIQFPEKMSVSIASAEDSQDSQESSKDEDAELEYQFKRDCAMRIFSNSAFKNAAGNTLSPSTVAKDAIAKANTLWESMPDDWK